MAAEAGGTSNVRQAKTRVNEALIRMINSDTDIKSVSRIMDYSCRKARTGSIRAARRAGYPTRQHCDTKQNDRCNRKCKGVGRRVPVGTSSPGCPGMVTILGF